MPSTTMNVDLALDLDVEYVIEKGSGDFFDRDMGQWYPGDAPTVRIHSVTATIDGKTVDMKDIVDTEQLKHDILEEVEQ